MLAFLYLLPKNRYLPNFGAMFTFPSALPSLYGGALLLLNPTQNVPFCSALYYTYPDHQITPLQVKVPCSGKFLRSGFAAKFSQPSCEQFFFLFFGFVYSKPTLADCSILIAPIISGEFLLFLFLTLSKLGEKVRSSLELDSRLSFNLLSCSQAP
jgi:hypothetical protein